MSVTDASIADARVWSKFILNRKFRGIGDTIERAAQDAEISYGVPASILLRLKNRHEISDMMLSNWLAVRQAYQAACAEVERQADHQEHLAREAGIDADNSRLFALASKLAGKTESRAKAEEAVRPEAQAQGMLPRGEEGADADLTDDAVSRLAVGRTTAATSEHGRDSRERPAPLREGVRE